MTEPVHLMAGDVAWRVEPEVQDQLLGPAGLRLDEWLAAGQAAVVKHGPHRSVYRVNLPGLVCYVKRNRLMNTRAWLRELIRPAKAHIEYDIAREVAARGVPTITPLAVGRGLARRGPADSFLVTRSLDETEQLDVFLTTILPAYPPGRRDRVRREVATALGAFLARMHDAGVLHHDLHPGNLLIRLTDDRPELFLIDLHAVRLHGPLGWPASRNNLVILNRWFTLRSGRTDRLRFWRAYCLARRGVDAFPFSLPVVRTVLPADLEERTWASNLGFWRGRDRRCLASNRYFQPVRSAAAMGHAVRDLPRDVLGALLTDPDAPFAWPGIKLLKDSRSSTVAEFDVTIDGQTQPMIYKRFRVTTWSDPWVALVRRSPALRSWVHGHGLRDRCLPTPRPLLVLHRCRNGLVREGYLLTEKLPDAVDLHDFAARLDALPSADRRLTLRRQIDAVARLLRELHRRQLGHRDLKASNILTPVASCQLPVVKNKDLSVSVFDNWQLATGNWQLSLIDLVGVSRYEELPRARRVKDLSRLHASFHQSAALTRTDRLRFLRVYLQWGLAGRGDWKLWWRDVALATAAKIARNQRSGRVLT